LAVGTEAQVRSVKTSPPSRSCSRCTSASCFVIRAIEWTQERLPLDWAAAQNNLGNALLRLGDRESGTKRLGEAVAAYRAALEERTRERVPLAWAVTQSNLGNALRVLLLHCGNDRHIFTSSDGTAYDKAHY
jgi:hypothetical protein